MSDHLGKVCVFSEPVAPSRQYTVIVTGAARGGTSMVAAVLRAYGLFLGRNLNSNHEDPDFLSDDLSAVLSSVNARNSEHDIWGFKAPQALELIEFYVRVLRNPVLVVVYRNPIAVARSYDKRSPVSFRESWNLMRKNYAHLLRALDISTIPVVLVPFEEALVKKREFVDDLHQFFNLPASRIDEALNMMVESGSSYKSLPGERVEIVFSPVFPPPPYVEIDYELEFIDFIFREDGSPLTRSDDPRIVLTLKSGNVRELGLLVQLDSVDAQTTVSKVYIDVGFDFSETYVCHAPSISGLFSISCDRPIIRLRYDPCECRDVAYDAIHLRLVQLRS